MSSSPVPKAFDFTGSYAEGRALVDASGNMLGTASNPVNVQMPDTTASGNLTAVNQAVTMSNMNDNSCVTFQLVGPFVGTVVPEVSLDGGTTWVALTSTGLLNVNTGAYSASATTASVYQVDTSGFTSFRIRCSAYTSGTIKVYMRSTQAVGMVALDNPLPPGTNGIGTVKLDATSTTGGSLPSHTVSAASTNATNVKASSARLYSIYAINTSAAAKYVKLFDKATAPTVGTDVPKRVLLVPASGSVSIMSSIGETFSTGLGFAITGAVGDLDATAVAAGDVVLDIEYL